MNKRAPRPLFTRDQRGAAAAEFALILPLMTMLLFGFYEAGRMYWSYNIVQAAVRDAARYGARLPVTCTGGVGAFDDAAYETRIKNLARTGRVDGATDPLVPGWTDNSTVTVTVTPCLSKVTADGTTLSGRYADQDTIPIVTVTANAPYGMMFGGLFGGLDLTTLSITNEQAWTG
jgi:Flp pilus assembly protein TadG